MAVGNLAEAQRRDAEWIESLIEREASARFREEGPWLRIEMGDWDALPEALGLRLARFALRQCGSGRLVSRVHLRRMLAFLSVSRVGTRIELPGGLSLQRDGRGARLGPLAPSAASRVRPRGAC